MNEVTAVGYGTMSDLRVIAANIIPGRSHSTWTIHTMG